MVLHELMIAGAEEHNRLAVRAIREAQAARASGRRASCGWLRCRKTERAVTVRTQPVR
ncbi:MAG: hypothetical protein HY723_06470 [Chloroflexi bacterium]|nr:hypothetical protein [Chloroflexota bacterium]